MPGRDANKASLAATVRLKQACDIISGLKDEDQLLQVESIHLLKKLIQRIWFTYSHADIDLLQQGVFQEVENISGSLLAHIQAITAGNIGLAHTAVTNAEIILSRIGWLPIPLQDEFTNQIAPLIEQHKNATATLLQMQSELVAKAKSIIASSDAIESKFKELEQSFTNVTRTASDSIERLQESFFKSQKDRSDEFLKSLETFTLDGKKEIANLKAAIRDDAEVFNGILDELVSNTSSKVASYLKVLETQKEQASKLYNFLGGGAMAGEYGTMASREMIEARNWNRIALAFFMGAAFVGMWSVLHIAMKPVEPNSANVWELFAYRFTACILILIPAFYAANEGARHTENGRRLRKTYLELAAIDAYLVELPAHDRNQIKMQLSKAFFGATEAPQKKDVVSKRDLFTMLQKLLQAITKLR